MKRYFEFVDGNSCKFWEITTGGKNVTVRFGRIGTNGQTQTKTLADADAATKHAEKLIKEKTGKDIIPTVILGACNPNLAYEAYTANSDVASLLPCNAVIREIAPEKISLEFVKPTAMMQILGDAGLANLAREADVKIERALGNV